MDIIINKPKYLEALCLKQYSLLGILKAVVILLKFQTTSSHLCSSLDESHVTLFFQIAFSIQTV